MGYTPNVVTLRFEQIKQERISTCAWLDAHKVCDGSRQHEDLAVNLVALVTKQI